MNTKEHRYVLRVDHDLFQKFRYVADFDGRSANRDIVQYIKSRVREFEKTNGEIDINTLGD